ncbi:hypothetical protein [Myroides fluvii]|uniref:hypothetical protein n=1 Tax=Myroides fluvii TaxID=2572594 RepID=UPI00131CE04A|nr:hypothetical protein [Myroides fluvii]
MKLIRKKGIRMLLVVPILFSSACIREGDPTHYHYTIENQSGVPVELKVYSMEKDGAKNNVHYISLAPNEQITKNYKDYPSYSGYNFAEFFRTKEGAPNVVEVIYENKKKTVFVQLQFNGIIENNCTNVFGEIVDCEERNLLDTFNYRNVEEHYKITKADYEAATDCDGDCH